MEGSHLFRDRIEELAWENDRIAEAVAVAKHSDVMLRAVVKNTGSMATQDVIVNEEGVFVKGSGHNCLYVGVGQPDARTAALTGKKSVEVSV